MNFWNIHLYDIWAIDSVWNSQNEPILHNRLDVCRTRTVEFSSNENRFCFFHKSDWDYWIQLTPQNNIQIYNLKVIHYCQLLK